MRTDGQVTFWQIQHRIDNIWSRIELPASSDGYSKPLHDPVWREHTACGQCWQRHGEYGFLSETEAMNSIPLVRKAKPDMRIRIARISMSQRTIDVARFEAMELIRMSRGDERWDIR